MKIPTYWARGHFEGVGRSGRPLRCSAWGWSSESRARAKADAEARARRIFERVRHGNRPDSYEYHEHPMREEIIESFGEGGEPFAVITRNRYGALVLNSAEVCFVDVDFPPVKSRGLLEAISFVFSGGKKRAREDANMKETVKSILDWAALHPQSAFRLYRTKAGLRLLFTDRTYVPNAEETLGLLKSLGSDPLYQKLTKYQNCFRARLTPKPWRCGFRAPPGRYPRQDDQADEKFRNWLREYERRIPGYVTCEFVRSFGRTTSNRRIEDVVALHDRYACGDPGKPLA